MNTQAPGTGSALRNSGIAKGRKGSTMLSAMILVWIILVLVAVSLLMALLTRIMEKRSPHNLSIEPTVPARTRSGNC